MDPLSALAALASAASEATVAPNQTAALANNAASNGAAAARGIPTVRGGGMPPPPPPSNAAIATAVSNPNARNRITQAARKIPNGFYNAGNKGIHAAPSATVSNSMVTNHWTAPASTGIAKPDNVNSSYVTTSHSPDDVTSVNLSNFPNYSNFNSKNNAAPAPFSNFKNSNHAPAPSPYPAAVTTNTTPPLSAMTQPNTMIPLKKRYTPPPVSSSAVSAPRTFIKEPEITPEAHRENTTFVQIHVEEHHHHLHTATKPPTAPQSQPPGYYNSYIHAPTTIPKSATTAVKPISSKALSALAKTPVVVEVPAKTNYPLLPSSSKMTNPETNITAPILTNNAVATAAAIAAAAAAASTTSFPPSPPPPQTQERRSSSNSTISMEKLEKHSASNSSLPVAADIIQHFENNPDDVLSSSNLPTSSSSTSNSFMESSDSGTTSSSSYSLHQTTASMPQHTISSASHHSCCNSRMPYNNHSQSPPTYANNYNYYSHTHHLPIQTLSPPSSPCKISPPPEYYIAKRKMEAYAAAVAAAQKKSTATMTTRASRSQSSRPKRASAEASRRFLHKVMHSTYGNVEEERQSPRMVCKLMMQRREEESSDSESSEDESESDHSKSDDDEEDDDSCSNVSHSSGSSSESARQSLSDTDDSEDESDEEEEVQMKNAAPTQIPQGDKTTKPSPPKILEKEEEVQQQQQHDLNEKVLQSIQKKAVSEDDVSLFSLHSSHNGSQLAVSEVEVEVDREEEEDLEIFQDLPQDPPILPEERMLESGTRLLVNYRNKPYRATVRKIRTRTKGKRNSGQMQSCVLPPSSEKKEEKKIVEYLVHYDGNKKSNVHWVNSSQFIQFLEEDVGSGGALDLPLPVASCSFDDELEEAKEEEEEEEEDPNKYKGRGKYKRVKKNTTATTASKSKPSSATTTIHDANVKYPIGTDVYVEYRNIFYYATVKNTRPSKKQPPKKYKRKSPQTSDKLMEYLVHYDGYKKTSDSWTIESKIWSINEDTTKRFREQRGEIVLEEENTEQVGKKRKSQEEDVVVPPPPAPGKKSVGRPRGRRKNSVLVQQQESLELKDGEKDEESLSKSNHSLQDDNDDDEVESDELIDIMENIESGVAFLPGSCVFVFIEHDVTQPKKRMMISSTLSSTPTMGGRRNKSVFVNGELRLAKMVKRRCIRGTCSNTNLGGDSEYFVQITNDEFESSSSSHSLHKKESNNDENDQDEDNDGGEEDEDAEETSSHHPQTEELWVNLSNIYEINPKTRKIFECGKRERLKLMQKKQRELQQQRNATSSSSATTADNDDAASAEKGKSPTTCRGRRKSLHRAIAAAAAAASKKRKKKPVETTLVARMSKKARAALEATSPKNNTTSKKKNSNNSTASSTANNNANHASNQKNNNHTAKDHHNNISSTTSTSHSSTPVLNNDTVDVLMNDIPPGLEFLPGSTLFAKCKGKLYLAKMLKRRGEGSFMEYFIHYLEDKKKSSSRAGTGATGSSSTRGGKQTVDAWVSVSDVYEINPQTKRVFNRLKSL